MLVVGLWAPRTKRKPLLLFLCSKSFVACMANEAAKNDSCNSTRVNVASTVVKNKSCNDPLLLPNALNQHNWAFIYNGHI